jgi:hypothetical protein
MKCCEYGPRNTSHNEIKIECSVFKTGVLTYLQPLGSHDYMTLVPYSQHSIIFVTYESAQKAGVLHNTGLDRLARDKCSNVLVQFVSFKEKEVL